MTFDYLWRDIPVVIQVTHYSTGCSMRVTGSGMGDADPPEEEEFEYQFRDRATSEILSNYSDACTDVESAAILQHFKDLGNY